MRNCSSSCNKVMGVLRVLLGMAMLYFGITKLQADPSKMAFVGGAAHQFGLTFLSVVAWYRIVTVGEIIAGLLLISGCPKLTRFGAGLTIIIMIFALQALGWVDPNTRMSRLFIIVSVLLLVYGPGKCPFVDCHANNNQGKGCCSGLCGGTSGKASVTPTKLEAGVTEMTQKAKEIAGQAKDVAQNAVEKADDLVEKAQELVEKYDEVIEKVGGEVGKKVVSTAKTVLDKADSALDSAQKVVSDK